jgi:hypothetical protein
MLDRTAKRLFIVLLGLAFSTINSGCATSRSTLTLSQVGGNDVFTQSFSQAYASRTPDGDYEIVLLQDATESAPRTDPGQPLKAAPLPPVRQVVHIRTLWRPSRGTKPDHPCASNGSIDWYVMGGGAGGSADMVKYEGVGFVTIDADGDTIDVSVRNASLKPTYHTGAMTDPLGKSRLTGDITARQDDRRVREVLAEVKSSGAVAQTASQSNSLNE